ncbi:helix-turn-helix domain-containing protein [Aneurinibacillus thermoaerophilus]|uniref:helix-turn-helix domain-containing protein n=1 Tax=Aneurinibacillus thermoaerophilus TaxID=143495 RepID=UPI003D1F445D
MGKLTVTQTHGFTTESLRIEERKMQDVLFKQRLTVVRLVMEGHSATEAGNILGICRQSVSTYVKMFNRSGLIELLHRDFPPGNKPYLSEEQHTEMRIPYCCRKMNAISERIAVWTLIGRLQTNKTVFTITFLALFQFLIGKL